MVKQFSIGIGLAAIFFAVFLLALPASASADPLPENASCVRKPTSIGASIISRIVGFTNPIFGSDTLSRKIEQYYVCEGNIPPVAGNTTGVQIARTMDCAVECTQAKGSFLEYKDAEGSSAYFCFGATEGKTCEILDAQGQPIVVNVADGTTKPACDNLEFGCWLSRVLSLFAGILNLVIAPLAALMEAIVHTLALALNGVINYVVSVPVSPSSSSMPEKFFVRDIWNFSRDLANSFFLLILAIIGLTTILRIQSYQWQKTLPSLVIAVLLINFSGVLVGFVVDMTNIVTSAFLKGALEKTDWGVKELGGTETLALHIGEIIFYFFIAFAYFATMLLFVVRTVVLWILAAIAPLAFALYVLPATKTYWQQWFKALFQWSVMGIPASFALYFASKAILITSAGVGTGTPPAFFAQAAGPFTAAIILIVGMGMALAGAPAVSQNVMNWGKKVGRKYGVGAAGFAGSKAWQYARDRVPHETREGARKASASANPEWGKNMGGLGGRIFRGAAGAYGYSKRTAGRGFTTVVGGSEQADIEKAKAAATKRDATGNLSALRQAGSVTEKTAILDAMRQKGQIRDAANPDLVGEKNILKEEEVAGIYEKAHQIRNMDLVEGLERAFVNKADAMRRFAEITDRMTANSIDANDKTGVAGHRPSGLDRRDVEERKYTSFVEKIIGEAKTADEIKALRKDWWDAPELIEAAHKFWAGNQFSQAATTFGRDFINKLEESKKDADWYFELEKRKDKTGREWSTPRNVAAPRYFASSAAQGLGLSPLQGMETSGDVTRRTNVANILAQQSLLEAPYIKLRGIMEETLNLERERRRGAPQTSIDALKTRIDTLKADIQRDIEALARGLGGANANKLEADWDRIEQLMQGRRGRRP